MEQADSLAQSRLKSATTRGALQKTNPLRQRPEQHANALEKRLHLIQQPP